MRKFTRFFRHFFPGLLAAAWPWLAQGADLPENAVLQYHFLGAQGIAQTAKADAAKKAFSLRSSRTFQVLVLNLLAAKTAAYLGVPTSVKALPLIAPLLDELCLSESTGSVGAFRGDPLDFVLAVKLPKEQWALWQKNLAALNEGPGEEFRTDTFTGRQWNTGKTNALWVVPAGDWLLVGRGGGLIGARSDYLRQIRQSGRPDAPLGGDCFRADIDWPRLAGWVPMTSIPLKPARMQISIAPLGPDFFMTGKVTYDAPIDWRPQPWKLPTALVHEPLTSFAAGQDVEPFLKSDSTVASLCTDPFRSQFYFWSMREMPLQNYVAWPDANPKQTIKTLGTQVPAAYNARAREISGSELFWSVNSSQILWGKLTLASPNLGAAPDADGPFLVGGLFPLTPGKYPAPRSLWDQFKARSDVVYYGWELTGPRIQSLRSVLQMVPVLQMLDVGPGKPDYAGNSPADLAMQGRLGIEEKWLAGLVELLGNTRTEITITGPAELTIQRNSPFVFTGIELVMLSHWLSDTPAGPVDYTLLPRAKITGPGIPNH